MSKQQKILISGGGGSIGSNLAIKLLGMSKWIKRVVVFDNNEYALACLKEKYPKSSFEIAFGDIRDKERLREVLKGIDIVVHAAALKRVEMAEPNIVEAIKVNVLGTINLMEACREAKVKKVLLTSSDKAVPVDDLGNYGVTKLMQERIVLSNSSVPPICSIVRMGNVIGTRGDVYEIWKKQKEEGKILTITDKTMRRFFWTMNDATNFIIKCLQIMKGSEIFISNMMKEYNLVDIMKSWFGPDVKFIETGLRSGEVFYHKLITEKETKIVRLKEYGWVIKK